MSLKFPACRPVAARARCTVPGLVKACSPTQITSENRYTPRQYAVAAESRAFAGAAWTTALPALDHKTLNTLKS